MLHRFQIHFNYDVCSSYEAGKINNYALVAEVSFPSRVFDIGEPDFRSDKLILEFKWPIYISTNIA